MNTKDREQLLTRIGDLVSKAQKTGVAHSKFLSSAEYEEVSRAYKTRRDITCQEDGGFIQAERRIAIFIQADWGIYQQEEVLGALCFTYRKQDPVRHQDVLGAVLGLGLSRDMVGDILIEPGRASLICLKSIADYIADRIEKLGRVGVSVQKIPMTELPLPTGSLSEKQVTVASLRLDAIIAAAFHLSRGDANELILQGLAALDHQECLSASKPVAQGSIVSVRGKGRLKLLAILGETKKGKIRINLGIY